MKKVGILILIIGIIAAVGMMSWADVDVSENTSFLGMRFRNADVDTALECTVEDREEMIDAKKAYLDKLVADGIITQEKADEIYANLETCLTDEATCTPGQGFMEGLGFGRASNGGGRGRGNGRRGGRGFGCGFSTTTAE